MALQALPSMGFSRQEYWSGLPFPSPGGLPDPRIEPASLMHWQVGSLPLAPPNQGPQTQSELETEMGPEPRSLDAKASPSYILHRDRRVMEGISRSDSCPFLGLMTSLALL